MDTETMQMHINSMPALKEYIDTHEVYMCNIDCHWIVLIHTHARHVLIFDSLGVHGTSHEIQRRLQAHGFRVDTNTRQLQGRNETTCGYWSLIFLYCFVCRKMSLHDFCQLTINDQIVRELFTHLFVVYK